MPPKPRLTLVYLQLLSKRKLSEAEDVLRRVKDRMQGDEWNQGYVNAMEGLLHATKSDDDRYLYLKRLKASKQELREAQAKVRRHTRNPGLLNPEFDRGYFKCWLDFLKVVEGVRVKDGAPQPPHALRSV